MTTALALWLEARARLHAAQASEHPDITDHWGRVWVWKAGDLYTHDGLLTWPKASIENPDIRLPSSTLADNPNYVGLCDICRSEWKDTTGDA